MSEDINKTINELHIYEKKVLNELAQDENATPEDISEKADLNIKSVMSAAGSLAAKGIITVNKNIEEKFSLTEAGEKYSKIGLPERRILNALKEKKELAMKEIANLEDIDKKEINIAIGWLVRKHWAKINKGVVNITEIGEESVDKSGDDENLISLFTKKKELFKENLDAEMVKGLAALKDRKNLIAEDKIISHSFELNDLARDILKIGLTFEEEATQLTHEQLKDGSWKDLKYRPYDINVEFPKVYAGKGHPLRRIIDEIREIFLNMGFTEANGNVLDSAFWNFDALFQPQDHAAREMQDTFYMKNPLTCDLPDDEIVNKVATAHEDGGNTQSEGWGYDWDKDVAKQSVLRTHTTGISTKYLANNQPPMKMFSVGRVFRRETMDYKHLPEFHQVEGLVAGEDINYQNLLGILKEFYKKLGFEVRFRPAYFPYTYLSTECEVYLEEKKSWIELGGSGMFRPEVLKPLGIDTPALAFGLGIERLAMIRYDLSDIRSLYKSDIKWLRELNLEEGIKLD